MRQYAFVACAALFVSAATTVVLAQPRHPRHPPTADAAVAGDASGGASGDASADASRGASGDVPRVASPVDAGRAGADATVVASADVTAVSHSDVPYPMRQTGTGTVIHFPIPEQLARTEVPVFAQIRSNAPLDHVSLFYRSVGARRYTELRMNPMGQQFHLPSGYGAQIPCEDVFPPRVEYYVQAIDQSNTPNGSAGTDTAPIAIPVVALRTQPAPTLPGQSPPRTCGTMTVAATVRDAGGAPAAPERGTGDLGEPCRVDNDCRRGFRCSSGHTCIFENTH